MKKLLFCFIAFFPISTFAQTCDCLVNFDYTTSHVADCYSGYSDKVKSKNLKEFNNFTECLRRPIGGTVINNLLRNHCRSLQPTDSR